MKKMDFEKWISVNASLPDGAEINSYYPTSVGSGEIVQDSSSATGVSFDPEQTKQMVQAVDYVKRSNLYVSELEVGATWKEGIKFKIKRTPKTVFRYYSEE